MKTNASLGRRQSAWPLVLAALGGLAANASMPNESIADENGISFWLPGQFASLAALPGVPGWSAATIYYHTSEMKSRVLGVGPQVGFLFPVGDLHGYLNLKAYYEFDSKNRPEGWNAWLTFAISPTMPSTTSSRRH